MGVGRECSVWLSGDYAAAGGSAVRLCSELELEQRREVRRHAALVSPSRLQTPGMAPDLRLCREETSYRENPE